MILTQIAQTDGLISEKELNVKNLRKKGPDLPIKS